MDQTIEAVRMAIQLTPENDPTLVGYLHSLGQMLRQRYERTRQEGDIAESLQQTTRAVATCSTLLGKCLSDLASTYTVRYNVRDNVEDLEQAVRVRRQAAERIPEDDSSRPGILNNLGADLGRLYDRRWRVEDIEEAIRYSSEAARLAGNDADRAAILSNLGTNLIRKHERLGSGLDRAMEATREALALTEHDQRDATWATNMSNLGVQHRLRYKQTGNEQDLNESARVASQALEAAPDGHPHRTTVLNHLGHTLILQYDATGRRDVLERAIQAGRELLELTPANHPCRPWALSDLGSYLSNRYEATGDARDIEEAIRLTGEAVELSPEDDPKRPIWLDKHAGCLSDRYKTAENAAPQDIDRSIELTRDALRITAHPDPHRALLLSNLGIRLGCRYEKTPAARGSPDDLDEAIQSLRESLGLTGDRDINRAGVLNNLGNQLGRQYERTGELRYLDEAIQMLRSALDLTPPRHKDRAMWLQNLGSKFCNRFRRTADRPSLREGIQAAQQSVEATPSDDAELGPRLGNLGNAFEALYERTENPDDLEEAIRAARRSLQVTPKTHANRVKCLNNLSGKLGRRFDHSRDERDIEEAMKLVQEGLELSPGDNPLRAILLSTRAAELSSRYKAHGRRNDIEGAARAMQEAVRLTPPDHPDRAARSNILGNMLVSRYEATSNERDLDDASSSYLETWNNLNAIPFHRVAAASRLVRLLPVRGRAQDAARLAKEAIDLLPEVSTRSLTLEDRQWTLSAYAGMAADACSLLLEAKEPEEALRYLESGRAVILGERMNDRNDVSGLKEQHPELARQYERLRDEVSSPLADSDDADDVKTFHMQRRRPKVVAELDACIERIRRLKGWSHFLRGLTISEMKECAAEDAIVVVNVTPRRSDAILVSSRGIFTQQLSQSFQSEAVESLGTVRNGIFRDIESEVEMPRSARFLEWLWSDCVEGILEDIEDISHQSPPQSSTHQAPRVWWIGVGTASVFPFHAAGSASGDNALRHVISSYTPTIKALAYSKSRVPRRDTSMSKNAAILVVTMPTTPGQRPLNADEEMREISEACRGVYNSKVTNLECPTASKVLECIPGSGVVHFACHGSSDPKNPSESHLLLVKEGRAGPVVDELNLSSIARLPTLGRAWIAYLSACSTAEVKARRLVDEGLHISSAFQVAGFPHVIGTLWSVADNVSVRVAKLFYQALTASADSAGGDGQEGHASRNVAEALRTAIIKVREEYREPEDWAAYIHSGA